MYNLEFSKEAKGELKRLKEAGQKKKLKKIANTLDKLSNNPRHPGLHTHTSKAYKNHLGKQTLQSYVENKTPGAYRIFWCYGLQKDEIVILLITPHL